MSTPTRRLSKPAPPHNPLFGKGVCGCVECSRWVLSQRCPVTRRGVRCGDWRDHADPDHTLLVATCFTIAEERVRLDGGQADG